MGSVNPASRQRRVRHEWARAHTRMRRASPPVWALVLSLIGSGPAVGADASLSQYVDQASQAYAEGDYAAAADAYTRAQALAAESSQVAYNLGCAYYQQGDFAKAKEQFLRAQNQQNADLEAKAKFNLGNVCYSQGLAKRSSIPEAVKLLQSAIAHYRDALDVNGHDDDARANIEMAHRLIKELMDQQKNQQKQQKNKDEQNNKKDQKNEQDKQPQSQPSADQKEEQKQQQENDKQKADSEKKDDASKKQEPKDAKPQDGQQDPQTQQPQPGDPKDDAPLPAQVKPLSQAEAERLLQSVRDRERERRQKLTARMEANRVNVKRDW